MLWRLRVPTTTTTHGNPHGITRHKFRHLGIWRKLVQQLGQQRPELVPLPGLGSKGGGAAVVGAEVRPRLVEGSQVLGKGHQAPGPAALAHPPPRDRSRLRTVPGLGR